MQLEMAYFALDGVPSGELDKTYASSLILAHSLLCVKTCHTQNQKYITYGIAVRGGLSHSHRYKVQKVVVSKICE